MSPTVRITGWRKGLQKISMTKALQRSGALGLADGVGGRNSVRMIQRATKMVLLQAIGILIAVYSFSAFCDWLGKRF